jgi:hypothetical protein
MKALIYLSLGAVLGGLLGYLQQCAGGTCPLMCIWWRGAIFGSLAGLLMWLAGRTPVRPVEPAPPQVDDSQHKGPQA